MLILNRQTLLHLPMDSTVTVPEINHNDIINDAITDINCEICFWIVL